MSVLIECSGDIFTTSADGIGHGVNVVGNMGGGIAAQFQARFPDMYATYRDACSGGELAPGECLPWVDPASDGRKVIYNIASQDLPGSNARLGWLATGVAAAVKHAELNGLSVIALPQIGCGIGGLDWDDVLPVLADIAADSSVDIEAWTYAV